MSKDPSADKESTDAEKAEEEKKKAVLRELGLDESEDVSLGYIPKNAKLNAESGGMGSPDTVYEETRSNIEINTVKKIAGGEYGKSND